MKTILAFPADTHGGSSVGLFPAEHAWQLADGNQYHASPTQQLLWRQWRECWQRVKELRQGGRLIIMHVGDAREGVHHDTTQLVTANLEEQERIHIECMEYALDLAGFDGAGGDLLYYIAGTEIHVGPAHAGEERIARDLGAIPFRKPTTEDSNDGRFVWAAKVFTVDEILFDVAHHGAGLGSRAWTRENGLYQTLKSLYFMTCEDQNQPPRLWIRAHKHRFLHATYHGRAGSIDGFVLPSFQSVTHYASRLNIGLSDIGMLTAIVEDGRVRWECDQVEYQAAKVEVL